MRLSFIVSLLTCVLGTTAQTCSQLINSLQLPSDVTIILTKAYPDNTTFQDPFSLSFPQPVPSLPAFCRVYANISTSPTSRTLFEVWLPLKGWNLRYLTVGNGGAAGGVNYPGLGVGLRAGFAVASTDTGHNSSVIDGAWIALGPEVNIDFGFRAVHLTTVYAKSITKQFYGRGIYHSYYSGCSSGGKQGLKSVQMFPEDFDGILIGAPAYAWANLTGFQIHVNLFQSDATSPSYITAANFVFIADQVTKACDTLDNVPDGIISNPRKCNFDTHTLLCSNFPNGTVGCLTPAQVTTLNNIYQDWTENGQYIFPSFEHGSENYFALSVLNVSLTTFDPSTVNLDVVTLADTINPGGIIADNPDLRPYFSRGGKIIHYHGWADGLIPTRTSVDYYNSVLRKIGDVSSNYRFFLVPGMNHCSGGPGPWNFNTDAEGAALDQTADLVDQLIRWVEVGVPPGTLLGTKYVNDTGTDGIVFQRPICPFPSEAVWNGNGRWQDAKNWVCKS